MTINSIQVDHLTDPHVNNGGYDTLHTCNEQIVLLWLKKKKKRLVFMCYYSWLKNICC